ncbi:hypothetical protein [Nocardia xishanensis]
MSRSDISAAARLLRYALSPGERPTPNSDYRELLDRYQSDLGFTDITDNIAEGLGLDVYQVSQLGLLVAGRVESPFGVTLDNCGLPIRKSGEQRLQDRRCFGLVLLAIITYAYPDGQALIDADNHTLRAVDLERFIEQRLDNLIATNGNDELGEAEGQLAAAARTWRNLSAMLTTPTGRIGRDCHRWYVATTLAFLVDQGRARRETALDDGGEAYVLNDRFRIGLSEVAESLITALTGTGDNGTGE